MASIPSSATMTIESPANPSELAALLADISSQGGAVAPIGGGTKLGFGNPLSRDAVMVSTRRLDRILAYEPDDMTISVEAGAKMCAVWNAIAERGLTIPIDVPAPESETIGGLIATGLCGPRRYGSGSLRDALIGIQAAYPDGSLGNAGGMVVKNVSGFDLMRMHLGAVGTLGVVVSANFKLVPSARGEATVTVDRESIDQLEGDRLVVHGGRIRPIAFEAKRSGEHWVEAIRIEGRPATVNQLARELADRLGDATTAPSDQSRAFWNSYVQEEQLPNGAEFLTLQVRGRPSAVAGTTRSAIEVFEATGSPVEDLRMSLGLGTVRILIRVSEQRTGAVSSAIARLRGTGLNVLLLTAPPSVHRHIDAFGTSESTLELMRQLKRQFDPWSVLNPGRVIPEL